MTVQQQPRSWLADLAAYWFCRHRWHAHAGDVWRCCVCHDDRAVRPLDTRLCTDMLCPDAAPTVEAPPDLPRLLDARHDPGAVSVALVLARQEERVYVDLADAADQERASAA